MLPVIRVRQRLAPHALGRQTLLMDETIRAVPAPSPTKSVVNTSAHSRNRGETAKSSFKGSDKAVTNGQTYTGTEAFIPGGLL